MRLKFSTYSMRLEAMTLKNSRSAVPMDDELTIAGRAVERVRSWRGSASLPSSSVQRQLQAAEGVEGGDE
jgi:hypothetical protein